MCLHTVSIGRRITKWTEVDREKNPRVVSYRLSEFSEAREVFQLRLRDSEWPVSKKTLTFAGTTYEAARSIAV